MKLRCLLAYSGIITPRAVPSSRPVPRLDRHASVVPARVSVYNDMKKKYDNALENVNESGSTPTKNEPMPINVAIKNSVKEPDILGVSTCHPKSLSQILPIRRCASGTLVLLVVDVEEGMLVVVQDVLHDTIWTVVVRRRSSASQLIQFKTAEAAGQSAEPSHVTR